MSYYLKTLQTRRNGNTFYHKYRKSLKTHRNAGYHQYINYSWYLDASASNDTSTFNKAYVSGVVYDDQKNNVYVEIEDDVSLLVKTLHCPEKDTIYVTSVDGEHWITGQKINIDTIRFDTSMQRKGKPRLFPDNLAMWSVTLRTPSRACTGGTSP